MTHFQTILTLMAESRSDKPCSPINAAKLVKGLQKIGLTDREVSVVLRNLELVDDDFKAYPWLPQALRSKIDALSL